MVKSGLGEDVIVEQIRANPGNYSLTSSDLIRLKRDGVPNSVIRAMQAQKAPQSETRRRAPESAGEPSVTNGQRGSPYGRWEIEETVDRMTGKKGFDAVLRQRTNDGQQDGEFDVTAVCDPRLLNFKIVFLSDEKPGVGFKAFIQSQHFEISSRVRIDDNKPKDMLAFEEFPNYFDVTFRSNVQRRIDLSQIYKGIQSNWSAGDAEAAIRAQSILVELTTENDVRHFLEIKPQDPTFQRFGSRCASDIWHPSAPVVQPPAPPAPVVQPTAPRPTALALNNASLGPAEKRGARTYKGNLDGFIAALPGYLQRASAGIGAPPRAYDYEIGFIAQTARQCAGITAEQAASVTFHNVIDVSRLGEAYRTCAAPFGVPVPRQAGAPDRSHPAELKVMVRPIRLWGDGNGISVAVSFTEIGFPGTRSGDAQSCAKGLDCGIALGLIDGRK